MLEPYGERPRKIVVHNEFDVIQKLPRCLVRRRQACRRLVERLRLWVSTRGPSSG